jgi:hypothetical protein
MNKPFALDLVLLFQLGELPSREASRTGIFNNFASLFEDVCVSGG